MFRVAVRSSSPLLLLQLLPLSNDDVGCGDSDQGHCERPDDFLAFKKGSYH